MRDYAASYQIKTRHAGARRLKSGYSGTRRQGGWRTMSRTQSSSAVFWKSLGVIVLLVTAIGVAASYWVGHRIQESLTGIAQAQELQSKKEQTRKALLAEQVSLLQAQRLEAYAAVQVGLYSPGKRQQVGF